MDLTVEQNCPSCGAAIELHEADRLLQCSFCGVRNYRISRGVTRFVLPDKAPEHIPREELFYAPYLRFKGSVFYCKGKEVQHRIVDITHLGVKTTALPLTLGLRPQAMKVSLLAEENAGYFFRQSVKAVSIVEMAAQLTVLDSEQNTEPFYHRAYIGETISYIYLPLYIHDNILYDAVTNSRLARSGPSDELKKKSRRFQNQWIPHFLATLCPSCGEALEGEQDSLVLSCHNCDSSWEEAGGQFRSLPWQRVPSQHKDVAYLPFWKIEVKASGVVMENFGDFLRLTNQPLVVRPEHDRMPLCFWIPAFKIRPHIFLNLAKNMTVTQKRLPAGEATMASGLHPVTLSRTEAVQALKTVLAEAALNKRDVLPLLPGLSFHPLATELVYLPFIDNGHDLVQEQTMLSVAGAVLRSGRSL
ncbi:MAG: hypothetical protein KKB91_12895 [Proteobacteria bacterium]|jgi:predicted RNA-binding Zn-ribbon protein involved in translation (DUF1610 family)|nr:hypothetical protein [Desulfocapsa sp.]MBU3944851.1 hypothetical protein [Pseudomonadota bacterium]MCG2744035.1 hypothetical protein [Desulfobacteraceae bacterium]MBU3983565.1 hypothetical protein [Pseudomonadota bacterium]MBU4029450.1 hypothetical protein [Pseudomonadota bacterium]